MNQLCRKVPVLLRSGVRPEQSVLIKYASSSSNGPAVEYAKAKPYDEIPGPKAYPLIRTAYMFLPGGKLYKKDLMEVHLALRKMYGDLVLIRGGFGKADLLLTFSADDSQTIFRNEGQWPFRRGLEVLEYFRTHERPDIFKGKAGLLSDQGEQWHDTRTKVNPVMLQPKTVKKYIDPVEKIADEFVERIRSIRDSNQEVPADFSNEMNKWALESIACIGLDQRLGLIGGDIGADSDAQKMIQAVHDFINLSFELEIMPSIWKYYKTATFKKMMKTLHTMTNITSKYVDVALANLEKKHQQKNDEEAELSVLEKLLKIDKNVAILMVLDMLMAGVDTTSMSTISMFYQLAKNPEKQNLLRKEIMERLPEKDTKLTPQIMANLPYLRACIKEISRLHPVVIGHLRKVNQDIVLQGYQIPKGTEISTSQWVLTRDRQYFQDGEQFLPERFLKEDTNSQIKGTHPFAALPFGFGPRMCIGRRFAELEMEVLLIKIIRNFELKWNYGELKYSSKLITFPTGDMKFQFKDL